MSNSTKVRTCPACGNKLSGRKLVPGKRYTCSGCAAVLIAHKTAQQDTPMQKPKRSTAPPRPAPVHAELQSTRSTANDVVQVPSPITKMHQAPWTVQRHSPLRPVWHSIRALFSPK